MILPFLAETQFLLISAYYFVSHPNNVLAFAPEMPTLATSTHVHGQYSKDCGRFSFGRYRISSSPTGMVQVLQNSLSFDWEDLWQDMLRDATTKRKSKSPERGSRSMVDENKDGQPNAVGTVTRCAARCYKGRASTPSSSEYTTRKDEVQSIEVSAAGVIDDYNHYRTVALSGTEDRAVSILTMDVIEALRAGGGPFAKIELGDLGENILVENMDFDDFQIGSRYRLSVSGEMGNSGSDDCVVLEITEPIVPCANLCKLCFINDQNIEPQVRIDRCKSFLERLAIDDGFRGWYAKVLNGGSISVGAELVQI